MSFSKNFKIATSLAILILTAWFVYGLISSDKIAKEKKVIGVLRYIAQLEKVEEGFYLGMEELGYKDGENVTYIVTPYGNSPEKMEGLAQDLLAQNVDLIVAITNVGATGAKQAIAKSSRPDLPVVFSHASSPDVTGLVKSFKSSGNNLTGVAVNFVEVTAKKLEFFRQIDPSIKRLGIIEATHTDPAGALILSELKKAAPRFGMTIVHYKVESNAGAESSAELTLVANSIKEGEMDAFFYIIGPVTNSAESVELLANMTKRLRIPSVFHNADQVGLGGLFAYSPDLIAMGKQTSVFVDKVLKGQKPSDIPVEPNSKNVLSLNLKTAQEVGMTFPASMLNIAAVKVDK